MRRIPLLPARTWAVLVVAAALFLARPWACGVVLGHFTPMDDVPYANFDRHGMSAGLGMLGALAFLLPVLWLIAATFPRPGAPWGRGGAAGRQRTAAAVIALAIAAPGFTQINYLQALPFALAWPVAAASAAWALFVLPLWIAFVRDPAAPAIAARIGLWAWLLAIAITLPKLLLFTG